MMDLLTVWYINVVSGIPLGTQNPERRTICPLLM